MVNTSVFERGYWLQGLVQARLVLLLCLLTDALILWGSFSLVTYSRFQTLIFLDELQLLHRDQAIAVSLFLFAMLCAGAYSRSRITDRFDSAYFASIGVGIVALGLFAVASMVAPDTLAISRRELLLGSALGLVAVGVWRVYFGGLASRFTSLHRFFYTIGTEEEARRIADEICSDPTTRSEAKYVTLEEARQLVEEGKAGSLRMGANNDAIITLTDPNRRVLVEILEFCEKHFSRTFIYPTVDDMLFFPHSKLLAVAGIPLIEVANRQVFSPYLILKRLMDISVASVGLFLSLPIWAAAILAIKLSSPGPVFYTQERMGRHGTRFNLYKFRSMISDAETHTGPTWAKANDARVTRVGRFLRKHRIDELPQLFNVLSGDMSLIGPRPERPHFHQEFCQKWPLFERRLALRPGVTSLSHVLGSYDSEPEDRLRYDLMYINNVSLLTDITILVATVRVVLGAKGAQ